MEVTDDSEDREDSEKMGYRKDRDRRRSCKEKKGQIIDDRKNRGQPREM